MEYSIRKKLVKFRNSDDEIIAKADYGIDHSVRLSNHISNFRIYLVASILKLGQNLGYLLFIENRLKLLESVYIQYDQSNSHSFKNDKVSAAISSHTPKPRPFSNYKMISGTIFECCLFINIIMNL